MSASVVPYTGLKADSGTMGAGCEIANRAASAWVAAAVSKAGRGVTAVARTTTCITVRVFGPYPGSVVGAPPERVWSGAPVK